MWLETAKMRPELTGNLLGGGLLGDMIIRLTAAQAARATGSQVRLIATPAPVCVF